MAGTGRIKEKEITCKNCGSLFKTIKPAVTNCSSECTRKYMYIRRRIKRKKNEKEYKAYYTNYNLQYNYGISLEKYQELELQNNGNCHICNRKPKHQLFVDHCHTTGNIRGLLCRQCNVGLGMFKDNIEILDNAKAYLSRKVKGVK